MVKRKITILEPAASSVAEIAFFIEEKGMPATAKNFVIQVFEFFKTLSDDRVEHRPCSYKHWASLGYRCITYKKYVIAYLSQAREIIICDFVASKLLR